MLTGRRAATMPYPRLGNRSRELLALLTDGACHSSLELQAALGLSRASVRRRLRCLSDCGVEIVAVRGKGYRLSAPLELLEKRRILAGMETGARQLARRLELHFLIPSTNGYILRQKPRSAHRLAVIAEGQTQGRGRGKNRWVSPLASGLYLSIGWTLKDYPRHFSALAMTASDHIVRALRPLGARGIESKWPNDLLYRNRKLGGILVEARRGADKSCRVVLGVGLNVSLPAGLPEEVDRPYTDLRAAASRPLSRNRIAATVLNALLPLMQEASHGRFRKDVRGAAAAA